MENALESTSYWIKILSLLFFFGDGMKELWRPRNTCRFLSDKISLDRAHLPRQHKDHTHLRLEHIWKWIQTIKDRYWNTEVPQHTVLLFSHKSFSQYMVEVPWKVRCHAYKCSLPRYEILPTILLLKENGVKGVANMVRRITKKDWETRPSRGQNYGTLV